MRGGDEVRLLISGTELLLRPISAADYIMAGKESREISGAIESSPAENELIKAASLAAKGLYLDDERAFGNVWQVLETLTPEELMLVAAEYSADKPQLPETDESLQKHAESTEKEAISRAEAAEKSKAEKPEPKKKRVPADIAELRTSTEKTAVVDEKPQKKITVEYAQDFTPEEQARNRRMVAEVTGYDPEVQMKMQKVSDYFERDSRRYSSGFERY